MRGLSKPAGRLRRGLAFGALCTLVFVGPSVPAAIPVVDVSGIAQVVAQITQTGFQLESMRRQVDSLRQSARLLQPRSYGDLLTTLRRNQSNYMRFANQLTALGYTIERVEGQFARLFPSEERVRNQSTSEFLTVNRNLNRELSQSSLVAMQAQSTLGDIQNTNLAAQRIIQQSEGNNSQVAQIQLAMQMLTVMDRNLQSIIQTVSTAGRVASNRAAAEVTGRRIVRERRRRDVESYARRVPRTTIDPRFLGGR